MSKKPYNYYVVWRGEVPGIYDDWEDCKEQIHGFPRAQYKGFVTRAEADEAYETGPEPYYGKDGQKQKFKYKKKEVIGEPILRSICVDGAWNTVTGDIEYRGVETATKKELFHHGPLKNGTNNVAEFLAIVHGLAYCKERGSEIPIYSDSRNAIGWVQDKQIRTTLEPDENNERIFNLLDRALDWLEKNDYPNEVLKWETKAWGENPADFGRK